jgi:hypothetical protein
MHAEGIIPTFSTSTINIGLCVPKALTLAPLWSYELFRNNKSIGLGVILSFHPATRCVSAPAAERDSSQ